MFETFFSFVVVLFDLNEHRFSIMTEGYYVVDKSNTYRMDPKVPLVVGGVNSALEDVMELGGRVVEYHAADLFPERWFDLVLVLRVDKEWPVPDSLKHGEVLLVEL